MFFAVQHESAAHCVSALKSGMASYFDPVATEKLVEELTEYCREHRIDRISDITGGMLTG